MLAIKAHTCNNMQTSFILHSIAVMIMFDGSHQRRQLKVQRRHLTPSPPVRASKHLLPMM